MVSVNGIAVSVIFQYVWDGMFPVRSFTGKIFSAVSVVVAVSVLWRPLSSLQLQWKCRCRSKDD